MSRLIVEGPAVQFIRYPRKKICGVRAVNNPNRGGGRTYTDVYTIYTHGAVNVHVKGTYMYVRVLYHLGCQKIVNESVDAIQCNLGSLTVV